MGDPVNLLWFSVLGGEFLDTRVRVSFQTWIWKRKLSAGHHSFGQPLPSPTVIVVPQTPQKRATKLEAWLGKGGPYRTRMGQGNGRCQPSIP